MELTTFAAAPLARYNGGMSIDDLLREGKSGIVEDTWRAVERVGHYREDPSSSVARLEHYEQDGEHATRQRLEVLYDRLAEAVRTRDLTQLVSHTGRVAKQRFEAGFDLAEVQTLFFMLEQAIWRHALHRLPPGELAVALGLVSTAVGHARDALGREFVSLASHTRAPSLDLTELFQGADTRHRELDAIPEGE